MQTNNPLRFHPTEMGYLPLFLTFLGFSLVCAQPKVHPPLEGTPYFYYGPEQIEVFSLSTQKIIVRFQDDLTYEQKAAIVGNESALTPLTEEMNMPAPKVSLIPISKSVREQEVLAMLERLENHPDVVYANPFLEYGDEGVLQGIMDEFIVKLKRESSFQALQEMAAATQTQILRQDEYSPSIYVLQTNKQSLGNALEMANYFHTSGRFEFAEPNFLLQLKKYTNDSFYNYQWSIENTGSSIQYNGTVDADMDVDLAWNTTTGSNTISVAILDEGVDLTHPDLTANLLTGYDATGLGSAGGPSNDDAHGTACAGIVAGIANNNAGIAGVAYSCRIVPIRIAYSDMNGDWVTTNSQIATAMNWAWNQGGADVLSNSWGGGSSSSSINAAINNALSSGRGGLGSPVLFSAGNGDGAVNYPANNNSTIAVAAMSMCNERKSPNSCDGEGWWGSDFGTNLDVAAPGVKIYTTDISGSAGYSNGDYAPTFNGTSSACPNAAGVMALILSFDPTLTATQARNTLEQSCTKVGGYTYNANVSGQPNGTWSTELGYGCVNANDALTLLGGGGGSNPCTAIPIACGATVSGSTVGGSTSNVQYSCINWDESGPEVLYQLVTTSVGDITATLSNLSDDMDVFLLSDCDVNACLAAADLTFTYQNAPADTYYIAVDGFQGASGTYTLSVNCIPFIDPTICNTTVASFPYTESYENGLGAWVQSQDDSLQWTNLSGAPGSPNTGPTAAYAGNYYMYIEASIPNFPSKTAGLQSPCLDLTNASSASLFFAYHMYGVAMGSLNVQVSTDDGLSWGSPIWTLSGDQGNAWDTATVDLTAYIGQSIKVRFFGTTGTDFTSDIAIDAVTIDITSLPFSCTSTPISCGATVSGTTVGGQSVFSQYNCVSWFESGPEVVYELILSNPSDVSASLSNLSDDMDLFFLDACDTTACLDYGDSNFSLANVPPGTYYLIVDGYLGASGTYTLDLTCTTIPDPTICNNTVSSFPYVESFENGLGQYVQSLADSIQWTNQSGGTPTSNTGPSAAFDGSFYMYTEASSNNPSYTAGLQSPCLDLSAATTATLAFSYHMFGVNMGTLDVEVSTDNGQTWSAPIWTLSGDQGNAWDSASVDLTPYAGQSIKVRFLGTTGSGVRSDMAVDRVMVHTTSGPLCQLFPPVLPTNLFATFLGQAQIEGIPAVNSDTIAAFDNNGNLAGKAPIIVSGGIAFFNLTIYGDDPLTPSIDEGMGPGETFTLRIKNLPACEVLWYPNILNPTFFTGWQNTNGLPLTGYDDPNDIYNFAMSDIDTIPLTAGWNLISMDVMPDDSTVVSVFGDLDPGNLVYVTGFDAGSKIYDPNGLPFLNTLIEVERYFAYWVRVLADDTLFVIGDAISTGLKQDLDAGWNLSAYVLQAPDSPSVYFNSLISTNNLVFVTGFDNGSQTYDPNGLPFLNTLTQLRNGFGYWVRVNNAVGGGSYRVSHNAYSQARTPIYDFINGHSNLGAEAVGQEVLVHRATGEVVAAMEVLEDGYLMTTAVYGDDPSTPEVEGLQLNEPLHFSFDGREADTEILFSGDMRVRKLELNFETTAILGVYPNPFTDVIQISYQLDKKAEVSIQIYNALGESVETLLLGTQTAAPHQASWNASDYPEGIYVIAFSINGMLQESHRVVRMK